MRDARIERPRSWRAARPHATPPAFARAGAPAGRRSPPEALQPSPAPRQLETRDRSRRRSRRRRRTRSAVGELEGPDRDARARAPRPGWLSRSRPCRARAATPRARDHLHRLDLRRAGDRARREGRAQQRPVPHAVAQPSGDLETRCQTPACASTRRAGARADPKRRRGRGRCASGRRSSRARPRPCSTPRARHGRPRLATCPARGRVPLIGSVSHGRRRGAGTVPATGSPHRPPTPRTGSHRPRSPSEQLEPITVDDAVDSSVVYWFRSCCCCSIAAEDGPRLCRPSGLAPYGRIGRVYDLTLVLSVETEDERRAKIVSDVESAIAVPAARSSATTLGARPMAYRITTRPRREYHLFQFHGPLALLESLSHTLRIDDGVLRFRVIKVLAGHAPAAGLPAADRQCTGAGPRRRGGAGQQPPRPRRPCRLPSPTRAPRSSRPAIRGGSARAGLGRFGTGRSWAVRHGWSWAVRHGPVLGVRQRDCDGALRFVLRAQRFRPFPGTTGVAACRQPRLG